MPTAVLSVFALVLAVIVGSILIYGFAILGPGVARGVKVVRMPASDLLEQRLREHVEVISRSPRNVSHPQALEDVARYLDATLSEMGFNVQSHSFTVDGVVVRNIDVTLESRRSRTGGSASQGTMIVGAHYDSAWDSPGAADNASAVAALLEIARNLKSTDNLRGPLRIVFFVNEEPPYFQTDAMGSVHYVTTLLARKEKIEWMVSLDSLGIFFEEKGTQRWPITIPVVLPDTANFVAVIGDLKSRSFAKALTDALMSRGSFPVFGAVAPSFIQGAAWSDHWSFARMDIPSVMVTDTALYRYDHYHQATDTAEKLNYQKLAILTEDLSSVLSLLVRVNEK